MRILMLALRWPPVNASAAGFRSLQVLSTLLSASRAAVPDTTCDQRCDNGTAWVSGGGSGKNVEESTPHGKRTRNAEWLRSLRSRRTSHTDTGRTTCLDSRMTTSHSVVDDGKFADAHHDIVVCCSASVTSPEALAFQSAFHAHMSASHHVLPSVRLRCVQVGPDVLPEYRSASSTAVPIEDVGFEQMDEKGLIQGQSTQSQHRPLLSPDIILYDTFLSEDMYGYRVRRHWRTDDGIRPFLEVLDTQDIHGLRACRQVTLQQHMLKHVEERVAASKGMSEDTRADFAAVNAAGGAHSANDDNNSDSKPIQGIRSKVFPPSLSVTLSECVGNLRSPLLSQLRRRLKGTQEQAIDTIASAYYALPPGLIPTVATNIDEMVAISRLSPAADTWPRELASMHRMDMVLLISPAEHNILAETVLPRIAPQLTHKLATLPFLGALDTHAAATVQDASRQPSAVSGTTNADGSGVETEWDRRRGAVFLGTFMHAPNVDCISVLRHGMWDRIRAACNNNTYNGMDEDVGLHVYGSRMNHEWRDSFHNPHAGFHMHGLMEHLSELSAFRVMLSPLRFGAGLKGKFVDAMSFGTPIITTSIGAEGFSRQVVDACMLIADDERSFIDAAASLLCDAHKWQQYHDGCFRALHQLKQEGEAARATHIPAALQSTVDNSACVDPFTWHLRSDSSRLWMARYHATKRHRDIGADLGKARNMGKEDKEEH